MGTRTNRDARARRADAPATQPRVAHLPLYAARTPQRNVAPAGKVFLVGAGPGHPDLLTVRAADVLATVDVVVYDRLVGDAIVARAPARAQRIYVGKARSSHTLPQAEICALLVRLARAGKRVARLKGGDPFVFGRGGEEIETLAAHGIAFEVVPGITAAIGVAAYAGIPLTHRDHAQALVFVTGHLKDGTMNLDWPALARPRQTIAVYMGLQGLPVLARELIAHGLAPSTPAAIVEQGTTAAQRVFTATLADLPSVAQRESVRPPTLVIVGEVVRLRSALSWFDAASAATVPPVPAAGD